MAERKSICMSKMKGLFPKINKNLILGIVVANSIEEDDTKEHELDPLRRIRDSYPKMVITRTGYPEYDIDGIKIIDITDWLMQ